MREQVFPTAGPPFHHLMLLALHHASAQVSCCQANLRHPNSRRSLVCLVLFALFMVKNNLPRLQDSKSCHSWKFNIGNAAPMLATMLSSEIRITWMNSSSIYKPLLEPTQGMFLTLAVYPEDISNVQVCTL